MKSCCFRNIYVTTIVLFVFCISWLLTLFLNHHTEKAKSISYHKRAEAQRCGFDGNSDIYGLGIRIGIYAQTFAAWIGSELARFNNAELNLGTNLFMSALLASLVWSSARHSVHVIEAFLMLQMLLCSWFAGTGMRSKSSLMSSCRGVEGEALNKLLKLLTLLYNVWFWWRDIDRLSPTPCGTYIFFIVFKFDLYGKVRLAHKVFSVLAVIVEGRHSVSYLLGVITAIRAKHLYSNDIHHQIEKEALQHIAILNDFEFCKGSHIRTQEILESSSASIQNPSGIKRRWSLVNLKQQTTIPLNATEGKDAETSPQKEVAATPPKQMHLLAILEADIFLENVTVTAGEICKAMERRGFKFGGSGVKQLSFTTLNKTYWRSLCGVFSLAFRYPKSLQSLIVTVFAYKVAAIEPRTHDTCMIVSAALRNPRLVKTNWEYLHLASQIRATRATSKRLPVYIWWSSAVGLFFCVVQILAVELTIVWNHINGIQDLSSVGQLIPFVIGCGGLVRMLYVEGKRTWRQRSLSDDSSTQGVRTSDGWADAYYKWKEHHSQLGWCKRTALPTKPV